MGETQSESRMPSNPVIYLEDDVMESGEDSPAWMLREWNCGNICEQEVVVSKAKQPVIMEGQRIEGTSSKPTSTTVQWVCVEGAKLNQRVYVNPLTQVPFNSPVDHSPAKSRGITLAVILECHSCPPELLFVRNAGEIQHVIRSGGALWLIVKCCPGAFCQTPLNGLHGRKQSVAVTKGLVGMGRLMIDLQWNSEDVSGCFHTHLVKFCWNLPWSIYLSVFSFGHVWKQQFHSGEGPREADRNLVEGLSYEPMLVRFICVDNVIWPWSESMCPITRHVASVAAVWCVMSRKLGSIAK